MDASNTPLSGDKRENVHLTPVALQPKHHESSRCHAEDYP
jgi:hypothetical protein